VVAFGINGLALPAQSFQDRTDAPLIRRADSGGFDKQSFFGKLAYCHLLAVVEEALYRFLPSITFKTPLLLWSDVLLFKGARER
jgi:hypothetical protein